MARKLTLKQNKFVKKTIETLNPSEAARQTYDVVNPGSAQQIAHANMNRPAIKKAIITALEEAGLTEQEVARVHKRNLTQGKNISASNTAMELYYKLKGDFAPEKAMNLNMDIDLTDDNQLRTAIQDLIREAEELEI